MVDKLPQKSWKHVRCCFEMSRHRHSPLSGDAPRITWNFFLLKIERKSSRTLMYALLVSLVLQLALFCDIYEYIYKSVPGSNFAALCSAATHRSCPK